MNEFKILQLTDQLKMNNLIEISYDRPEYATVVVEKSLKMIPFLLP